MMRKILLLASLAALWACNSQPAEQGKVPAPATDAMPSAGPALDPAALESRNCADVANFYAQAIGGGDYASAEKVWKKDLLPAGGLAKQFASYGKPQLAMGERTEEGAAGSLYCEVAVTLRDAADASKKPAKGMITFRRVNDVDGATPEQLRWHIEKSEIEGIGE